MDLVAVGGRRVGSVLGEILGAEWGATASLSVLSVGVIGGGLGFALLCYVSQCTYGIERNTEHGRIICIRYRHLDQ